MRSQESIQNAMTTLIRGLSERNIQDHNLLFSEVLDQNPDIKEKWNILLKEAEELRLKGMWKFHQ